MTTEWLSIEPLAWLKRGGRWGCGLLAAAVAAITPTLVAQAPPSPPTPSASVDASPPPEMERPTAATPIQEKLQSIILPPVVFEPASLEEAKFFTKVFRVPPDFLTLAFTSASRADGGPDNPTPMDVLKQAGMEFPEGATASFKTNGLGSFLFVRNTSKELDLAEQFVESISPCLPKVLRWRSHWTPGSTPPKR
jgi:hypothetical protein